MNIELDDGTSKEIDTVIFCTGYDLAIDYFDRETKQKLGYDESDYKFQYLLYKFTFHPLLENFAMVYQNEGIFLIASELQGKWASLVFSGKVQLPLKEEMFKFINGLEKKRQLKLKQQYPYGSQVDVIDILANELNISHDFEDLKVSNSELYNQLWNNVSLACQFRLERPSSIERLREINELKQKEYLFGDDDTENEASITEIAKVFNEEQKEHQVPIHLFRN